VPQRYSNHPHDRIQVLGGKGQVTQRTQTRRLGCAKDADVARTVACGAVTYAVWRIGNRACAPPWPLAVRCALRDRTWQLFPNSGSATLCASGCPFWCEVQARRRGGFDFDLEFAGGILSGSVDSALQERCDRIHYPCIRPFRACLVVISCRSCVGFATERIGVRWLSASARGGDLGLAFRG
jgi:hypothetical protein